MRYSTDKSKRQYVNEFKELLKKADIEHQKTPAVLVEKRVGVDIPQNVVDDIISNVSDRIETEIGARMEDFTTNTEITKNELRALRGILNVKGNSGEEKIEFLKIESNHWKIEPHKEENKGNAIKSKLYESFAKAADLKADEITKNLKMKKR